jgi:chromosomal replication initiation ATPase DnaA
MARYVPTARERYLELCAERPHAGRPRPAAPPRRHPALSDILGQVAEVFAVDAQALAGRSRSAPVAAARHAAMWLLRERYALSSPAIGALLGRDHTTVLHGLRAAETRRRHDAAYKARLDALAAQGGAS